jgi:recombination associated protein RdgC
MTMFYRNLTLFRIPPCELKAVESALIEAAPALQLKDVGPLELSSRGWVSPFGAGSDELVRQIGDFIGLTLGFNYRILPGSVVQAELSKKLGHIRETEGRNPGGRERKRIKDEVLTTLIPRSFVRPSRLAAHIDTKGGWVIVDTSSRKNAETFVSMVRETLGSFPAVPVNAESSPRALMTAWIAGEPLPEGFTLGEECELRDPVDSGAVIKARNQELGAEEIREHLSCGKQAFRLALVFEDRLSFVLDEGLGIRKLKFLEAVTETLDQEEREDQRQESDAVFALQTAEIRRLLGRLSEILTISKVSP